ncbi:prephenate dehydrogenase [Actinoplanes sp. SE50]|uniref:prephenate dehydrogenase n=1 Tax=unclassified Actinoplanes TaxID=2626549 RepID=UPI00023EE099|nr:MULTISPECIES: prephenate dehydrogenase/arogenate dehydrogenase family protein [unclassified Actinoplanes]AEV89020.1 prephenate dehydrogenase [Actinoplanes sp. SE50/110]ATO87426.1 prephenate dehydrogenase [Actinoplanes sp. SE50]SLM04844.1 prephenate dehydrogenase [Actinoplanes sp. SE50/110]
MRIAVVGLGLIGGSLARALRDAGHEVSGFDTDPATRELARAAGLTVPGSVAATVAGTEVTVLAAPLPVLPGLVAELAGYDGVLTDVTSVKGPVQALAERHGVRRFVGGHPMAGTEASGFAAADPKLFEGCVWVLCVEPDGTDPADWLILAGLFTGLGARVLPITAVEHDNAVAAVSHVPHLLAAALATTLAGSPLRQALAAGSFRDGTRVAATRAELINAMCAGNATEVLRELQQVISDLVQLRDDLAGGDLIPFLAAAGELRRAWPPTPGSPGRTTADVRALLALGRGGGWVTAVVGTELNTMRPETGRNGF